MFWHLIDICKVNAWNMYRRDYSQLGLSSNKMRTLCQFANKLGKKLMHTNKTSTPNQQSRPSKLQRSSSTNAPTSKRAIIPTPGNHIRYENIGHCLEAVDKKERCRNCQSYSRMKCMKCNLTMLFSHSL